MQSTLVYFKVFDAIQLAATKTQKQIFGGVSEWLKFELIAHAILKKICGFSFDCEKSPKMGLGSLFESSAPKKCEKSKKKLSGGSKSKQRYQKHKGKSRHTTSKKSHHVVKAKPKKVICLNDFVLKRETFYCPSANQTSKNIVLLN